MAARTSSSISSAVSSAATSPGMMTTIQVVSTAFMTPTPTTEDPSTTDSASTTNLGGGGPMKPVSYLYPSIALVLFVLLTIHMCRFLERRRMVRRGRQLTPRQGSMEFLVDVAELSKPVMYDVAVEPHASVGRWDEFMPLSATVLNGNTSSPEPRARPPVPGSLNAMMNTLRAEGLVYTPKSRRPSPAPVPSTPLQPELLTGVIIAMPTVRHNRPHDVPPDVALGYRETTWRTGKEDELA